MAVFIELTTDVFSQNFDKIDDSLRSASRAGSKSVRRPLRGIEVKDDTYAIIKVVDVAGSPIRMFDSSQRRPVDEIDGGEGAGTSYGNFMLQGVQEARMEKQQIVETFGESYIFFFGEAPRFLDVSAVLINSNDFNWEAEFWGNYDAFWRGSKLTELGARLYLFYDDTIVEGYMLNASAVKNAQEPWTVQVQFRLFVTNYTNVSFVDSDDFPIRSSIDQSLVGNLSTVEGVSIQDAINKLDSEQRGKAEQNAVRAIQQAAVSRFGGGTLLAAALRQGLTPGMGPMLAGGAGLGVGASIGISAGVGVGVGVSAGQAAGISTGIGQASGVGMYAGPGTVFSTGSYTGFPPNGRGGYGPSPYYPPSDPRLPFTNAPLGANPFAPNPFAARPFAPNAFGVNPYYPNPNAPTPFRATPGQTFPRDSIFGPGFAIQKPQTRTLSTEPDPGYVRKTPLRGKIWENVDEWTGASPQQANADFSNLYDDLGNVEDLPYAAFLMLGAYGVGTNGYATLTALGLAPRFSPGGRGLGSGAFAGASASFGLSASASASASVGFTASGSLGFRAGAGVSAGIGAGNPYAAAYATPAGVPANALSPYQNYPGYGSGYGSGLPGLNGGYSPGSRLGVGVSAGVGIGDSFGGGVGSGAAVMVGGPPTCFALDSFPGTLVGSGGAFMSPDGRVSLTSFTYGPDGSTFSQRTL
jgi:hypothetical protein